MGNPAHTSGMKVLFLLFFIAGFLGCSSEPKTPEEVVLAFFEALEQGNYLQAGELAEPHSRAFLALVQNMAEVQKTTNEILDLPQGGAEILKNSQQTGGLEITFDVLRNGKPQQIVLVQENGKWRVKLPESFF